MKIDFIPQSLMRAIGSPLSLRLKKREAISLFFPVFDCFVALFLAMTCLSAYACIDTMQLVQIGSLD
jgi:hypothetical protein